MSTITTLGFSLIAIMSAASISSIVEPGTETGTPGNWWTVFALVPDCLEHAVKGFQFYRDPARKLGPQLRELDQTRAGYGRQSQFVYSRHCKSCRSVGLPEEKIQAIAHWTVSDQFNELERAVLAYTDALVLEGGRVADEVFAVLKKHLSDCVWNMTMWTSRWLKLRRRQAPQPML